MDRITASERYNRRVAALGVGYGVLLVAAEWLMRHVQPAGALAALVAILPALPIVAIFVTIGRYLIEERDEYLRMLMVRQSLIATGLTLSIATVWGFLDGFDLVPHAPAFYVAVLWFAGLGIGALVNRVRP